MIIGIDGNEANVNEQVGVSVYTLSLLEYFSKEAKEELQFRIYLRDEPKDFLPKQSEHFKYIIVPGKFLWSQIFLPLNLYLKKEIDVFFSPAHYTPRFCPVPIVVTIHDLSYFYYPQEFLKKDLYKLENWTKLAVEKSKKIIAVSKNTKKDIVKFYQTPDEKIDVVYNGFKAKTSPSQSLVKKILSRYELRTTNYILYVGTLQPRKNLEVLIEGFKKVSETEKGWKLVLVGKKGWLYNEIFNQVKNLGLEDKVIFTGYLPDDEVAALYSQAFCFVLPSLYEGFGIPILEAMSYSCPVITSFSSSLPEIGGEAALYLTPDDVNDLVDEIMALKDENTRKDLIKKGLERVKLFSWEKCAQETLEIIKQTS
ncbi:MAG: glycosyltransferase family 4 protein [Candidatus Roizmanbacteria bacterium]|nr:MAG: glycosyltransferase family 4 protein [Candidatus Roizmanbacteria bacterium]